MQSSLLLRETPYHIIAVEFGKADQTQGKKRAAGPKIRRPIFMISFGFRN